MQNNIINVSSNEMTDIMKTIENDSSLFIAQINCNYVQDLQEYLNKMSEVFHFPFPSRSIDSYNDWMRDLDWLNKDGYVLVFYNFKEFLCKDLISRKAIIDGFSNVILPFWQEEVIETVVEGESKLFTVYLVE